MTITYHENTDCFNRYSQWNNIIAQSNLNITENIYLIEPCRPKQKSNELSEWLLEEIDFIPDEVKGNTLIVFHIYEWVNIDHNKCRKLLLDAKLKLEFIRILVPVMQLEFCGWIRTFPSYWIGYHNIVKEGNLIEEVGVCKRNKKFTCLNRRVMPHRLYIVSKLLSNNLLAEGYISLTQLNDYVHTNQFTRFSTSPMLTHELTQNIGIEAIRAVSPLRPDESSDAEQNNHTLMQSKFFNDAYWNIVTETFNHNVVRGFLTEKTFKPIANLQPFVIIGTYRSLRLLRSLGFKTFDDYIDESYDEIKDETERLKAAVNLSLNLARMSHEDHMLLMAKMKPILEHNQQLFQSAASVKNCFVHAIR